jgi:hypothetical protein
MTNGTINQYDSVQLLEDVNPKIKRGMKGVILEKYNDDNYEIEFLDNDGKNIEYEMQFTFTIKGRQIRKIT